MTKAKVLTACCVRGERALNASRTHNAPSAATKSSMALAIALIHTNTGRNNHVEA